MTEVDPDKQTIVVNIAYDGTEGLANLLQQNAITEQPTAEQDAAEPEPVVAPAAPEEKKTGYAGYMAKMPFKMPDMSKMPALPAMPKINIPNVKTHVTPRSG